MSDKMLRNYVSDIDQFLQAFDKEHANSKSQQKEVNKHQRVFLLRDIESEPDTSKIIW